MITIEYPPENIPTGSQPITVQVEDGIVFGQRYSSSEWLEFVGADIPDAFLQSLQDIEEGRVVDIDIAHDEPPPNA